MAPFRFASSQTIGLFLGFSRTKRGFALAVSRNLKRRWIAAAFLAILCMLPESALAQKIGFRDSEGNWRIVNEAARRRSTMDAAPYVQRLTPIFGHITFEIAYMDVVYSNGVGFDDPICGAERRATVAAVLEYVSGVLNKNGGCQIDFRVSQTDGSGALASGGPFFFIGQPYEKPLSMKHILTGVDPSGIVPDIEVTVDFGWPWHCGTEPNPGSAYDLYSVLLHELTHGLGLISLAKADGASSFSPDVVFSPWDNLLYTGNGSKLWNLAGALLVGAGAFTGAEGGIFFRGSDTAIAYGGFPGVYAPPVFAAGSSMGHWAADTPGSPVMLHSIGTGIMRRTYAPFEIEALSDVGYDIVEPVAGASHWECY